MSEQHKELRPDGTDPAARFRGRPKEEAKSGYVPHEVEPEVGMSQPHLQRGEELRWFGETVLALNGADDDKQRYEAVVGALRWMCHVHLSDPMGEQSPSVIDLISALDDYLRGVRKVEATAAEDIERLKSERDAIKERMLRAARSALNLSEARIKALRARDEVIAEDQNRILELRLWIYNERGIVANDIPLEGVRRQIALSRECGPFVPLPDHEIECAKCGNPEWIHE